MEIYTITDIENMTEAEVKRITTEEMKIKGFNVYFVNIPGAFGYSYFVFGNGHHIKYANDYELHHSYLVKEEGYEGLREYYIKQLNNKLFTDEEIAQPLKDYSEYEAKRSFLCNLYCLQQDYISQFQIFTNKEQEEKFDESIKGLIYNPVGFCYMDKSLKPFIEHQQELRAILEDRKNNVVNNFEYQKNAFISEMYNHEYNYTFDDEAVLTAFGLPFRSNDYRDLDECFNILKFTQVQRDAYRAARAAMGAERKVA